MNRPPMVRVLSPTSLTCHRLHVAVLGQAGRDRRQGAPPVGIVGGSGGRRPHDHQVRLAHLPLARAGEDQGRGACPPGLPRGAPTSAQAANVAISSSVSARSSLIAWMPTSFSRNHGGITPMRLRSPVRVLDAPRPRAHLFVRQQRHRRHRVGTMAALAVLLQDRRDVPGEGHRLVAGGLAGGQGRGEQQQHRHGHDAERAGSGCRSWAGPPVERPPYQMRPGRQLSSCTPAVASPIAVDDAGEPDGHQPLRPRPAPNIRPLPSVHKSTTISDIRVSVMSTAQAIRASVGKLPKGSSSRALAF